MLKIKLCVTAIAVTTLASAALSAPVYDQSGPPSGPYLSYDAPGYYGDGAIYGYGWGRPLPGSREALVDQIDN
jgi:hypothetical protein